jgi:DNA-binding winged helix-turn-helix (wHTH) protein
VPLPPKVVELLVALVQAAGRVLTREQLLQQLWPNAVVEEGASLRIFLCCVRHLQRAATAPS